MLQHHARLSQSLTSQRRSFAKTAASNMSLISRLSERTHPRVRHAEPKNHHEPKSPRARSQVKEPRSPVTSFISARSARQRDHATEKWFTNVRKLDIDKVDQLDDAEAVLNKKVVTEDDLPRQHQLRPKTDLKALFSPSSAMTMRLQTKKELGGDYTKYLPDEFADPYRLPVDYARLALGRNKHIPLAAQVGALNIIEEAIRGRIARQGKYNSTWLCDNALIQLTDRTI